MESQLIHIQSKIYQIRGQKVMLDFDLAKLYQTETRIINQAVKRNIERFPDDFMFQLTSSEWECMSSQIVMTLQAKRPKSALPFVFTEHGVVMLSSILRSDIAVQASILVVRAFVAIRQTLFISPANEFKQLQYDVKVLQEYIEDIFADQNDINESTRTQLDLINQALAELQTDTRLSEKPRRRIGFIQYDDENKS
jgi:hypothetical protein